MKKIILAAALLLSAVGANTRMQKFGDPVPECPPACSDSGQDDGTVPKVLGR